MSNLFVFFSLLAASIDRFVSGFIVSSLAVKFKIKEFIVSFVIIFLCCLVASAAGNYLSYTDISKYINYMGVAVMLWLAFAAIQPENRNSINNSIVTISFSVAADAAVVCLYLSMCGNNPVLLSLVSAILHSSFLSFGINLGQYIISEKWLAYAKYTAAVFFAIMAVSKIIALHN